MCCINTRDSEPHSLLYSFLEKPKKLVLWYCAFISLSRLGQIKFDIYSD